MEEILSVKNGCFEYEEGNPIVKDMSLSLNGGEILSIMGRNGVGKTTLIRCIIGSLGWKSGESVVCGKKVEKGRVIKEIGYVPQAHEAIFPYTVRDMVVFGRCGMSGTLGGPGVKDYEIVDDMLELVGLSDLRYRACNKISGGQLQLVYLARALVNDPRLLIMDEPESHLDISNEMIMLDLVRKIVDEKKIACIINTHQPNTVIRISDMCVIIGPDDYVSGSPENIVTEENFRRYFDVESKIYDVEYGGSIRRNVSYIRHL